MNEPLIGIKVCVFDAYGTLFDFAAASRRCQEIATGVASPVG
jgi:2-haloacid dehalogenase